MFKRKKERNALASWTLNLRVNFWTLNSIPLIFLSLCQYTQSRLFLLINSEIRTCSVLWLFPARPPGLTVLAIWGPTHFIWIWIFGSSCHLYQETKWHSERDCIQSADHLGSNNIVSISDNGRSYIYLGLSKFLSMMLCGTMYGRLTLLLLNLFLRILLFLMLL